MFYSIKEFHDEALAFAQFLRDDRGYDGTVEVYRISYDLEKTYTFAYTAVDSFQESLESNETIKSGHYQTLSFSSYDSLQQIKNDWPSRAEREFRVLAKKLTNVRGMSQHLTSLSGKAFHEEIIKTLNKYQLLEAPKGEEILF